MNFDWITSPLVIYAVLAAGGAAALHLVVSTKIEMRRMQKRHLADRQSLHEAIAALERKVQQVGVEVKENMAPPAAYVPFVELNVHKKAEDATAAQEVAFTFEMYASGEYSAHLESIWAE